MTVALDTFRQELFSRGLLIPMGVDGLYGRSETFEDIGFKMALKREHCLPQRSLTAA